ncbi:OmpW/AlkL family protein [Cupriavidus nantongensis]|uniref:OmpW/AlkL family protein n=1 Tax=Cupriavidus nantongensis TaxID=1796606 RepID=UPI0009EEFA21|nr:OmpW family outer membrane protein [Cupriavidus nantongensis]
MKRWRCVRAMGLGGALLVGAVSNGAYAQSAGDNVLSIGWVHGTPQTGSDPLTVTSIGGMSVHEVQSGSGLGSRSADTVGFLIEHYFTDHIGLAFLGGFPAKTEVEGRGTLHNYGVLGNARTWAPELTVRYHFGESVDRFRPFVGVGVNYTWFTNAQVTNGTFVTEIFGPGSSATASASSSWNPAFQAGFDYRISKHWSAGASLMYVPTDTNVTLTGRTANGTVIVSQTKLRIRPLMTFLTVSYKF